MAQRLTESFINTNTPGAYPDVKVQSTPVGVASSGNIVIVGEADGGESFDTKVLKDNFFTPDQLDRVARAYIRGPIVDAMRALSAPSADANIQGSANRIYILKTNQGTKASALIDTDYGTLEDQNWGADGNKIKYQIKASQLEDGPSITSDAIAALSNAGATAEEFDITTPAAAAITSGQYFTFQAGNNGIKYYGWYKKDGVGTDPAPAGRTGVQINITTGDTADDVALATQLAIDALSTFAATVLLNVVSVTASQDGEAEDAANFDVGAGFSIAITAQGGLFDATALNGLSFSVRNNGGAATVITLSSDESEHDTAAELAAEIDAQLPSGLSCEAGTAADTIRIFADEDAANYRKGWGKAFELIDSTPGDLAAIELAADLYVSNAESEVELDVNRSDTGLNEALNAAGEVALQVGYQGTSATLSISAAGILSTTVAGGTGASLSGVKLSDFATVKDLAEFLASKTGYSAEATAAGQQAPATNLDKVTAIGICSTAASLEPGRVKKSLANWKKAVSQSRAVEFDAADVDGLPTPMASPAFLAGGAKGSTSAADIVDAIAQLEGIDVNFVVPLFSRDAADDIADGLTESASAYSIDAVHAATKSHCLKMSTPKLKKNRIAMLSFWGAYSDAKSKAQALGNFRVDFCPQKSSQVDSGGVVRSFLPWHSAAIAAGMQAAGFYKGITNKFANVVDFEDPAGFDSGNPGDVEDALDAGLLILQKDSGAAKWVSDQTTYGFDTNFVYNSLQAVYLADLLAIDLSASMQRAFVGQSLADVSANTALSFLASKMDQYKKQKVITSSDDAPLGFKNAKVTINGPTMAVSVEVKLSTSIYFVPITIEITQVQQSAG